MNRMMRALWAARVLPAVGLFGIVAPALAVAQAGFVPLDSAMDRTWTAHELSPAEILGEVRQVGFYPISRPQRRGHAYIVYAVDQDDIEAKLSVDAATGRLLWAAGSSRFGRSGSFFGFWPIWRPPGNIGQGRLARRASAKQPPPMPRSRPMDLAGGAGANIGPLQATGAPLQAAPVTMVPVAPLE